ncbi:MAG TPA: hypothetical protein VGI12_05635 [Vicinamibacterales bacterium]|jgi:hypothetical protein
MVRRLCLAALLLALPITGGATVLLPIELRELVSVSTAIVHGRVVDVHADWADGRRAVETRVTVDAVEYMKGSLGGTITVQVPGGQIGRYRTIFVGAPEFHQGDEVVLFLRRYNGALSVVGVSQGAFRVSADARRIVSSAVVVAVPGAAPEPVIRGDVARRPLAIDAFRDLVGRIVAEGTGR